MATLYANIAGALTRVDSYIRNNPTALYEVEGRELNRVLLLAMAENSERNAELIALRARVAELEGFLEKHFHRGNIGPAAYDEFIKLMPKPKK